MHLLTQLTDNEMLRLAIPESAKLVPYVTGSWKAVKVFLRTCLDLWSTAEDGVRIAAFVANTYLTLVRSCKSTSPHTLPSINLMKNSASEIYCLDHATAYQHAFGYIRQLAIYLRNIMKVKSKEAYKQVACDKERLMERNGAESELKPVIYPLVQVSLGSMKLIRNPRSYPFHLHIVRSLLHLTLYEKKKPNILQVTEHYERRSI
ncbi:uncharacterized protein LAESUDRAFT_765522 [Laetiporus sulphureus 93-53]|uniref:Uncharacterized protein n=1 Tax=Laetiporus sulphureus 93-53 TaxID=1314785 RepID=A0A165AQB0_9APHY|nr:uncharacterized protein LAESUDRAFT_765522 [Laetiporus sulphureus 93-53]KZS99446.1 hypothetical protein LAESUDRAFT_765522 [Laetiporus sulphureus 93-53]